MDSREFDALISAMARTESRRRAAWLVGSVVASALIATGDQPQAAAKPLRHHPTCHDRKRNGAETDVDCGGPKCPRCRDGKRCLVDNDCVSGTCVSGRCGQCTPTQLCGSDANGACQCNRAFPSNDPVCVAGSPRGLTVDDCAKCPVGTEVCVSVNGVLFDCYLRCGSVIEPPALLQPRS